MPIWLDRDMVTNLFADTFRIIYLDGIWKYEAVQQVMAYTASTDECPDGGIWFRGGDDKADMVTVSCGECTTPTPAPTPTPWQEATCPECNSLCVSGSSSTDANGSYQKLAPSLEGIINDRHVYVHQVSDTTYKIYYLIFKCHLTKCQVKLN